MRRSSNVHRWNVFQFNGELAAYQHSGYWYGMDTLRDKILLNSCGTRGKRPGRRGKTDMATSAGPATMS